MKGLKIRRLVAVGVMAQAIIAVAAAPSAAGGDPDCVWRTASVSDAMRVEGNSATGARISFEVSTTGCGEATVEVRATAPGPLSALVPATATSDYIYPGVAIAWNRGDTSSRTINVSIVGDLVAEHTEGLALELFNPSSGLTLTDPVGIGMIINDDIPDIGLDNEPDCGLRIEFTCELVLTASRKSAMDLTVQFGTIDGTAMAGEDYVGIVRGTLVIPAGQTIGKLRVAFRSDRVMVVPEHFYVDIFEPSHGTIGVSRQKLVLPVPTP